MKRFKPGQVVRTYHHCTLFDDAEVVRHYENGALDVKCVKTGTRWGWGTRNVELVADSMEEYKALAKARGE